MKTWTGSALALLCACGPRLGGGGEDGSGEDGSGEAGSGEAGSGEAGSGDEEDTGTTCPELPDAEGGVPVELSIHNARDAAVFVALAQDCWQGIPYSILGANGTSLDLMGPFCGTCDSVLSGEGCLCPGQPPCFETAYLWLDAGATFETTWSGVAFVGHTLPAECVLDESCGADCEQRVVPEAGDYAFQVVAASSATGCLQDPCGCEPGPEGHCHVEGSPGTLGPDAATFDGPFSLPGAGAVTVTID